MHHVTTLGVIAMKGYSEFPKLRTIALSSKEQSLGVGVSYSCTEMQSEYSTVLVDWAVHKRSVLNIARTLTPARANIISLSLSSLFYFSVLLLCFSYLPLA